MGNTKLEGTGVKLTDKLIADQEKQIFRLTLLANDYVKNVARVKTMMFGIGGPLNYNKHGYTKEQREIFYRIDEALDTVSEENDYDED